MNRKIEIGARTIKQLSCKSETVNMLNRIGLPLAKKIRREKFMAIRKELKASLERETNELMEYSKPDRSATLVDSFYQE